MKYILVTALLVIALPYLVVGQPKEDSRRNRHSTEVKEVMQLQLKIAAAIVRGDTSFMRSIYAPEYIFINGAGVIRGRTQVLEENQSGELQTGSLSYDDIKVRVYGRVAVVTGVATVRTLNREQIFKGQSRFTRVHVRRKGQWQVILYQVTRVTQ